MSMWKTALSAAVLTVALVPAAHADDFTKLTVLTFSAPVDLPGITLPAGTYRFALADPESGRRAISVSTNDGKQLGVFLSIPDQRATATDKPVVMFKEAAAGSPAAVQVWFYPAEHTGYEFVYPHDQALKIAKATHEPVLAQNGNDISRIDENDRPVSADAALKESSEPHQPVATTTPAATTASTTAPAATTASTASTSSSSSTAPASTTASAAPASTRTSASTTASASNTAPASTTASARMQTPSTVGTTGSASATPAPAPMTSTADTAKPARKHLPRTASPLPLLLLLAGASFAGAFGVRAARQSL